MVKVINQVYWDAISNTYMAGTRFKKYSDRAVSFENKMMAPGQQIMSWTAANNYQQSKSIPQLPLLVNGRKYQVFIKAETKPAETAIKRLTFFDGQRQKIKQVDFRQDHFAFTFPVEAVTYTLALINAGCEKIVFKRLQIGDEGLAKEAFADIYFNQPVHFNHKKTLNLILVMDNIHARKIWSHLEKHAAFIPFIVININWQGRKKAGLVIKKWLAAHNIANFRLISTNSKLNSLIPDIFINQFNVEYDDDQALKSNNVLLRKDDSWYSEDICDPDWLAIFRFLRQKK